MLVGDGRRIFLTLNIDRDVLHRTWAVERNDRDHVFDIAWANTAQRVAHARAFKLEHAERFAARHQFECRGII